MVWMCLWGSTWLIWAIVWEVERKNHGLPCLGFLRLSSSNRLVQAVSAKNNITIEFAMADLGGQGPSFLFISRIFAGWRITWPEKTTGARAPASLTRFDRRGGCVARWSFLIRSLVPDGVHAWLTVFQTFPWRVIIYMQLFSTFPTPDVKWSSG